MRRQPVDAWDVSEMADNLAALFRAEHPRLEELPDDEAAAADEEAAALAIDYDRTWVADVALHHAMLAYVLAGKPGTASPRPAEPPVHEALPLNGGAGLRVRREALGLSQAAIAELMGVAERSVRRWETQPDKWPAPPAVGEVLDEATEFTNRLITRTVLDIRTNYAATVKERGEPPASLDLLVYTSDAELWAAHPEFVPYPASWHRRMLWEVRCRLQNLPVRFAYAH